MKKRDYLIAAGILFAIGVLNNTLPVYAVTGLFGLGCVFAAYNPENFK